MEDVPRGQSMLFGATNENLAKEDEVVPSLVCKAACSERGLHGSQ